MVSCQVWVKANKSTKAQNEFGQNIYIVVTNSENSEEILFVAGPYIIPHGQSISHSRLTGLFDFGHTPLV